MYVQNSVLITPGYAKSLIKRNFLLLITGTQHWANWLGQYFVVFITLR